MALHLSHNSISLAGEFAVLSQLALRGFDANMTLGRTKSVDILVSDPDTGNMFKMEVKTNYRKPLTHSVLFGYTLGLVMSKKHESVHESNLYYCFYYIERETHNFRFFVVPDKLVAKHLVESHTLWIGTRDTPKAKKTTIRLFRIGLDDDGYPIPTPLAKDYENKWEF